MSLCRDKILQQDPSVPATKMMEVSTFMESSHNARLVSQDNIFVQHIMTFARMCFSKHIYDVMHMALLCAPNMCTYIYISTYSY